MLGLMTGSVPAPVRRKQPNASLVLAGHLSVAGSTTSGGKESFFLHLANRRRMVANCAKPTSARTPYLSAWGPFRKFLQEKDSDFQNTVLRSILSREARHEPWNRLQHSGGGLTFWASGWRGDSGFSRGSEKAGPMTIARDERVSAERIRQIVSEVLGKRVIDRGADHAHLQLERLMPALRLVGEAIGR